ncbi:Ig-like domain-containing protein [Corallococcus sp. CA047B]|uniref:Ig-like domain-containing protein n=1 Tax=Corallococcus sp. CA047B TaxID=2316729 RepID=UPI0013151E91|nr:Ig-like domain-containing protein [Corallococcus sp. CA047B]
MKNLTTLLLSLLLIQSACIAIPEIEEPQVLPGDEEPLPCSGEDAGTQDPISVNWSSPVQEAWVVGATARIQVNLTGPTPDAVELIADGRTVAMLASPYMLDWETRSIAEGIHRLVVRASRCGEYAVSSAREVTVDRTGPTLISQSPGDGSQWVSVHQVIQAELSEPVVAGSVNSQTVRLLAGEGEIQTDVLLSQTGKVLTLRPLVPLPVHESIRVVIDATVTDVAGNPVTLPVRGWTWRVPAFLPLGEPRTSHPAHAGVDAFSLQLDSLGNPHVAWVEADAPGVHVERWTGTAWQTLGNSLKGEAGDPNATDCVLQLASTDAPMVAWIQPKLDGRREVQVRLWDGSAWGPWGPTIAPLLAQSSLSELQMRIWGTTTPVVAFKELNASTVRATVMRLDAGEWKSQGGFEYPSDKSLVSMQMELNRWGDQFLMWNERAVAPGWTTYVGQWQGVGRQTSYPYPSIGVASPILASTLSGDTNVVVANPVSEGDVQSVRVQQWGPGGWVDIGPALSRVPGKTNASASALKFDPQGRLVALIEEPETEAQPSVRSLFVQRWETDHWTQVGGPLNANPGATSVIDSQLAVDKNGRIFLAWTEVDDQDPTQSRLHVYRPND